MRLGLLTSAILHTVVLGWALVSVSSPREFRAPEQQAMAVSMITPDELTRLTQGVRSGKANAQPKKKKKKRVTAKPTKKPKPVPVRRAPAPTPPPPKPEPKVDPIAEALAKSLKAEQVEKAQAAKAANEKRRVAMLQKLEADRKAEVAKAKAAAKARADAQKLKLQKQAEAKRAAADKARKAAEAKRKAAAKAKKLADARKRAAARKKAESKRKAEARRRAALKRKKLAAEKRRRDAERRRLVELAKKKKKKKKKRTFDADRISALLNKVPDKSRPEASDFKAVIKPPKRTGQALGAPEGRDDRLSASELSILQGQIQRQLANCWRLPGGGGGAELPVVTLNWRMRRNGMLEGIPRVVQGGNGVAFRIAEEAAIRAVKECEPFNLPADKYKSWSLITWEFDPRSML